MKKVVRMKRVVRKQKPTAERVTLQVPEVAKLLGTGQRSVRRKIDEGIIPHIKFGRKILVPKVALQRWIESVGA
jgi:excisionase family DNA binding protein